MLCAPRFLRSVFQSRLSGPIFDEGVLQMTVHFEVIEQLSYDVCEDGTGKVVVDEEEELTC